MADSNAVTVTRKDAVALVLIDNPPVNALSRNVRQGLLNAFKSLSQDSSIEVVVLSSRNGGRFIAGADIKEMDRPVEEPLLPDVIAALDRLPQKTLAVIDGSALGGGMEIALACDVRIGSPSAVLGLTETRLGIIPGAGGTQRLLRLIGIPQAIRLIAEGRILKAREALDLGLLDHLSEENLSENAIEFARQAPRRRLSEQAVPVDDALEKEAAIAAIRKKTKGATAAEEAIRVISLSSGLSFQEGLALERRSFLQLRDGPEARALRHLFKAEREAAKIPGSGDAKPRPVGRISVIGGGTMGIGIAAALSDAGLSVDIVERDAAGVAAAGTRLGDLYKRQVEARRLTSKEADKRLARVSTTADWKVVAEADLVIEAAFEDLDVKIDIFKRLDGLAKPGAILASNTSYLDLNLIANATKRPKEVVGLHFFAPANIMRLLEIVQADETAPDVLATAFAFARKIGKQAVLARVCDGFIGNRIFSAYRRQCEIMLEEGALPEEIDAALEAFGFAMGPFAVADLSGLDISWSRRKRLAASRDPRERYVPIADMLCEQGRFGQKSGAGWYRYPEPSRRREPDPEVRGLIEKVSASHAIARRPFSAEEIQNRALMAMVNEAALVLEDHIAQRPSDIDVVFAHGYGFPAVRGGPLYWAGQQNPDVLEKALEAVASSTGHGFKRSALIPEILRPSVSS